MNISTSDIKFENIKSLEPAEREVIQVLTQFENKVREAGREYSPAIVANFAYELAKTYNQFYQNIPIFNEADVDRLKGRIVISRVVADAIKRAMNLLGIQVPERM
jgi:arginyl-tRNA synthetase